MRKDTQTIKVEAVKPRNVFAFLGRMRRAGAHRGRDHRQEGRKDLVQRLREAGAI